MVIEILDAKDNIVNSFNTYDSFESVEEMVNGWSVDTIVRVYDIDTMEPIASLNRN